MVNHNLFRTWTEKSAYVFGFWVADGHILIDKRSSGYYKKFFISNTDKQIIDDIAIILGKSPIIEQKRRPGGIINGILVESRLNVMRIQIYSDALFDFCYKSMKSTQTQKTHNKHLPHVPKNMFNHFVRGYFDGDGSVFVKTYKNRHGKLTTALGTSFVAAVDIPEFLESLRNRIRTIIPIGLKKIIVEKSCTRLTFNQYDSALLCNWMYKGATIYMQRKKAIWDAQDKERCFASSKFFSNKV